ncbi:hypothetical protein H0H87_004429, partial [Tephrocybe sp. NHM501043]
TPDLLDLDNATVHSLALSPSAKKWAHDIHKDAMGFGAPAVYKITPTLLVKSLSPPEMASMCYLRRHTTIPIPQPRYPHLQSWMVMDFIEGAMLKDCWPSLGLFMKLRVACTLRGYISQLRQLRSDVPGRLGDGIVRGPQFEEVEIGPFKSAKHFQHFCELIAQFAWNSLVRTRRPAQPPSPVSNDHKDHPLVFTHGDLNLTNLLLDNNGVLWVIDWAESGFYPECLESAAMSRYDTTNLTFKSWERLRWFISGSYPSCQVFWDYVEQKVQNFRR